jgi:ArsR family transcriptional regulator
MAKAKRMPARQVQLIAKALADPRRYAILQKLCPVSAMPCCTVLASAEVSAATLSHHMKELETAGLVEAVREGRNVSYLLRKDVVQEYVERVRGDLL